MRAVWYERQGPASQVLITGEMADPHPQAGEVRMRVVSSGVNPGDVKKRQDTFGLGMPCARVIPHSDGSGVIDEVGAGVAASRTGERVWCFGAQSYRPFGTAAEYVTLPAEQAIPLADGISFGQGACLGIPGITAHRAVDVAGSVAGRTVLVQGGAGAVGQCAVGLARQAGARVIATARSGQDETVALRAGAHFVVRTDGVSAKETAERIRSHAPDGVDHIVEVAFDANIELDAELLAPNGSIAAYGTGDPSPGMPFWPLAFKNVRLFFLGSDDFPREAKQTAARGLNKALEAGWPGFEIEARFRLEATAEAHSAVEERRVKGRIVVNI